MHYEDHQTSSDQMKRRNRLENEINPAQRRIALTLAYLKVVCPGIDLSTRRRLVDSILALMDGEDLAMRQRRITDAQVVEMVWRHSQCVLNQTGRCPLLVFGRELADELNEFFTQEKRSGDDF
jgi:hypothetical protein